MTDSLHYKLQTTLGTAYTLERELGGGGMSRVFLAEETRFRRRVVLKVLAPELAQGLSAERFEREIGLAAALQEPHIVPVLSAGDVDGLPWYSMPYVAGENLRERMRAGAVPLGEAVSILRDVARALAYAHGQGVVHRDIKPENVLLHESTAVVADFGIAKALQRARTEARDVQATTTEALTQLGTSLGTPAYMAPEQAAGDPGTDHRADIYAWGVMAYELLMGRHPFANRTSPQALMAAHFSETPAPLPKSVPRPLAEIIARSLAKDPADRPQTALEIVQLLDALTSAPATDASGFRSALLLYTVSAVGVVVVAKAATIVIGLPDWVVPSAIILMLLGLPLILFTGHYLSWTRARRSAILVVGVFIATVLAFMATRALGVGPAASLFAKGVIKEQDRVLVADFDAPATDSSLGSVVTEGVRSNLSQTRAITIVPTSQVTAALVRMKRPATARLDLATAREIAQREGYKAVIDGKITPVSGGGFILTARIVSAETGDEWVSFRESARDASALIPAIDKVTKDLRAKLGESLKSVRAAPTLERVTTASLPALREHTAAMRANNVERNYLKAIAGFEDAIKLDSTFALAYVGAAFAYRNAGLEPERAQSYLEKAFQFREHLPDRERALIEGVYYTARPTSDRQLAIKAYLRFLEIDPSYSPAYNNLANLYRFERRFATAESLYKEAIARDSTNTFARTGLATAQLEQGELDAAVRTWTAFTRAFPGTASQYRWNVVAAKYGVDSARAECNADRRSDNMQLRARAEQCVTNVDLMHGQVASSFSGLRRAIDTDSARGVRDAGGYLWYRLNAAEVDATYRGHKAEATRVIDELAPTVPLVKPPLNMEGVPASIVEAYVFAERPDKARAYFDKWLAALDTAKRRIYSSEIHIARGRIAKAEAKYDVAIREYLAADTLYDGQPSECPTCIAPELGAAYDLAGRHDEAIATFEKYLASTYHLRWLTTDPFFLARIYKRLGELYDEKNDLSRAAQNYREFIALWKNADPELQPLVRDARARLALVEKRQAASR